MRSIFSMTPIFLFLLFVVLSVLGLARSLSLSSKGIMHCTGDWDEWCRFGDYFQWQCNDGESVCVNTTMHQTAPPTADPTTEPSADPSGLLVLYFSLPLIH